MTDLPRGAQLLSLSQDLGLATDSDRGRGPTLFVD